MFRRILSLFRPRPEPVDETADGLVQGYEAPRREAFTPDDDEYLRGLCDEINRAERPHPLGVFAASPATGHPRSSATDS